jgi:hypothetical protein
VSWKLPSSPALVIGDAPEPTDEYALQLERAEEGSAQYVKLSPAPEPMAPRPDVRQHECDAGADAKRSPREHSPHPTIDEWRDDEPFWILENRGRLMPDAIRQFLIEHGPTFDSFVLHAVGRMFDEAWKPVLSSVDIKDIEGILQGLRQRQCASFHGHQNILTYLRLRQAACITAGYGAAVSFACVSLP